VTSKVHEEVAQNVAQSILCQNHRKKVAQK
jgi:hypothetical protein